MAKIREERDAALAILDDTVRQAADAVSDSTARLLALVSEMEEIDETTKRLRARRAEVYQLREGHSRQHAKAKAEAYAKVAELLNVGQVPPSRRLSIVVDLVYGRDSMALPTALREGRRYLSTLDDIPFLCMGYVFLSGSLWCGGRTLGGARVELKGNAFCIAMPVSIDGRRDTCNIPIDQLARPSDKGYVCQTQAYVGEEDIVAATLQHLKRRSQGDSDVVAAREALAAAGFTAERIDEILAHINN
jgi:hypothetical protein